MKNWKECGMELRVALEFVLVLVTPQPQFYKTKSLAVDLDFNRTLAFMALTSLLLVFCIGNSVREDSYA